MTNQEALQYLRDYFAELFTHHNLDALDEYLAPAYFDDDIGDPNADHLQNSKDYLSALFKAKPSIGVEVIDAIARENVISAFLDWTVTENNQKRVVRKGVAIFILKGQKIARRHTFVYAEE